MNPGDTYQIVVGAAGTGGATGGFDGGNGGDSQLMIPRNRLIAGTVIVPRHVPGSIAVINTALLICTFPPGVSRWLKLDLVHRAERKFHVPVIHVVTEAAVQARR